MIIEMTILLFFFVALNAIGSANFLIIRLQQDKFNE